VTGHNEGESEPRKRPPEFLCDAMLGGLAKWLRAAGYSAEFDVKIKDGALVRRAWEENKVVLTSDSGILERYAVDQELVETVFVPLGLSPVEQLAHVLGELNLDRRESRCMQCNGKLETVTLNDVRDEVPQKVQDYCDEFFRCRQCHQVFWHGTHWTSIEKRLNEALEKARSGPDQPQDEKRPDG